MDQQQPGVMLRSRAPVSPRSLQVTLLLATCTAAWGCVALGTSSTWHKAKGLCSTKGDWVRCGGLPLRRPFGWQLFPCWQRHLSTTVWLLTHQAGGIATTAPHCVHRHHSTHLHIQTRTDHLAMSDQLLDYSLDRVDGYAEPHPGAGACDTSTRQNITLVRFCQPCLQA